MGQLMELTSPTFNHTRAEPAGVKRNENDSWNWCRSAINRSPAVELRRPTLDLGAWGLELLLVPTFCVFGFRLW
jgi:hypothetical protein